MQFSTAALLALVATPLVSAHMEMLFPPPLKSKFNPASKASGNIDYSNTSPLESSGSNYPCKGYQSLLGTPDGVSVATFVPGNKYNFTITGGAFHEGGSCQASLSYDKGQTFTVIQSIQGGCPTSAGGSFDFTVPADAPSGTDVLFAWTWFNRVGNREMYMNCASVTIGSGGSKKRADVDKRAVAYSARPAVFKANLQGADGCTTAPGMDLTFPNPGPDVVNNGNNFAGPVGSCEAPAAGGGAASPAAPPVAAPPAATSPAAAPATTSAKAPGATSSSLTIPGGVFKTVSTSAPPAVATSSSSKPAAGATTRPAVASPTTTPISSKPTTTVPAPLPAGTGSSSSPGSGSTTPGTKCTNEGAWNCIGGTAFQRCASGVWSVQMSMAAGTKCVAGIADTLTYARRKGRTVRMAGAVAKPWV